MRDWHCVRIRRRALPESQSQRVRPIVARAGEHQGARLWPQAWTCGGGRWSKYLRAIDDLYDARAGRAAVARPRPRALPRTNADPGNCHPSPARRPRSARHRPDRHRQDRRVRPADAAASGSANPRSRIVSPRAPSSWHRRANWRCRSRTSLRRLGDQSTRRIVADPRRRQPLRAGAADAGGRRYRGRHARSRLRPDGHRRTEAERGQPLRAGRGRPHARPRVSFATFAGSSLPCRRERQSALFSATMPAEVGKLAETLLRNPVRVDVARSAPVELPIEQHVHFVAPAGKRALLDRLLTDPALSRVIVFTRTKRAADRVADTLEHRRRSGERAARQQEPAGAGEGAGAVPQRPRARAGRDRHRRARDRRDRHLACHQLRSAGAAGGLRAPHRPHRACRRERRRHIVLRCRGARHAAGDRAHDRHGDQCRRRFAGRRSQPARGQPPPAENRHAAATSAGAWSIGSSRPAA